MQKRTLGPIVKIFGFSFVYDSCNVPGQIRYTFQMYSYSTFIAIQKDITFLSYKFCSQYAARGLLYHVYHCVK